ncbi:unnamed protein product [Pseudo-nitzschia multistriata]|uniref:Uncharacterized protein n=1 Tax=Pseudo-nitzschia multistriata TaxID=183589 RepID=A0A448YZM8_9STRA|nr:unnamed protein product [Pseudo-nitzschia multistriata]
MTASAVAVLASASSPALASVAEIDKSTGSLYTPKKEMLAGGSAAARGIRIEASRDNNIKLKSGQQIQTVYETRFIAYLSRFLINFDDAANGFWISQTQEQGGTNSADSSLADLKFAEFSESVEIGLADYFVGPYGSYSSLSAMKAGINAKYQAKSKRYSEGGEDGNAGSGILRQIAGGLLSRNKPVDKTLARKKTADRDRFAKQGVLNLYTLLKARYTTKTAKRQLTILFSFISNPATQPTAEIRSLLGEIDDASINKIEITRPFARNEVTSRTSCKRGGGYSIGEPPAIEIEPPPALGSAYKCAKARPIMKTTSRVLRINVVDGGQGYWKTPEVYVSLPGAGGASSRQCVAQAIIDREGHVESIVVLDPGHGYGRSKNKTPPKVIIKPPESRGIAQSRGNRPALAKAELEYEIVEIEIVEKGNGYVGTEPPLVTITPPEEEPDWYVDVAELAVLADSSSNRQSFGASVVEMRGPKGNLAYSPGGIRAVPPKFPLRRVREDPIELLPSVIRPEYNSYGTYVIPSVAAVRTYEKILDNPRFRAVDPLFGAIGALPAQKSAMELKPNEYARLALSGAVCTVLVRTALNPLELIKTKLQLENDEELLAFARQSLDNSPGTGIDQEGVSKISPASSYRINENKFVPPGNLAIEASPTTTTTLAIDEIAAVAPAKISPQDLIGKLIELRGFPAIFQSADITLLASLVFGSLGFGATELFRRSFTEYFFNGEGGTGGNEVVLLLAATVATIITCAAAAPFELLRVRSMGLVESQEWVQVMKDFLKEKSQTEEKTNGELQSASTDFQEIGEHGILDLRALKFKDYLPLWAGFGPTTSRELAFAIPKFLAFDIIAKALTGLINSQLGEGALPIQVGIGTEGLAISAFSGACAGIAGAFVSHPADLILTRLSASKPVASTDDVSASNGSKENKSEATELNWKEIVKELLAKEGGVANLYVGLAPRLVFFFLVIGLQFFLYDYVKNILEVGSDDLSLVLDVFYAVRQGLS